MLGERLHFLFVTSGPFVTSRIGGMWHLGLPTCLTGFHIELSNLLRESIESVNDLSRSSLIPSFSLFVAIFSAVLFNG